jgi:hypothetical protein
LAELDQKLIVTDYGLAHWIAQTYQLDLNDWPRQKPDNIQKDAYESLKKSLKKFI